MGSGKESEGSGMSIGFEVRVGGAGVLLVGVVYLWTWCSRRTQVTKRAQKET